MWHFHLYLTGQSLYYTHLGLTGQSYVVLISSWLAAMGCNPMLGLWTGQPCIEYESHCRLTGCCVLYPSLTDWSGLYYTIFDWLASCVLYPSGQSCVVLICSWLAGLVLYPSLTDWSVLYYTHLWLDASLVLYPSLTDWPVFVFIPIFDWLASLALYPSLTYWPVLHYTHLWLTGQSCVVLICSWLASHGM